MTVTTTNSKVRAQGNGVTTAFTFTFKVFAAEDLTVYKIDRSTEVSTEQTLGVDYTVALQNDGDTGGTVTYTVAPTSDEDSFIIRELPFTQETDFPRQGKFPEEDVTDTADKAVMLIQQNNEIALRSVQLPAQSEGISTTLPNANAGKALRWNDTGDALINSTDNFDDIVSEATTQATNAANSATSASNSASAAATSASNASTSATNAATSASEAAASAASLNIAEPVASKHGALLFQNDDDDGYDLLSNQGTATQVLTSNGPDAAPTWEDAGGGEWVEISTTDISSATSNVDFTDLTNAYNRYKITLLGLISDDPDGIDLRISQDNGTSFESGASDYTRTSAVLFSSLSTLTISNSANDSELNIACGQQIRTGSDSTDIEVIINRPWATGVYKTIEFKYNAVETGTVAKSGFGSGFYKGNTNAFNAVRIFLSPDNLTDGRITLWGSAT